MPCKNFSALVSHSATPPLFPSEFNFDICHLSEAENVVADALSRPNTTHFPSVPKMSRCPDVKCVGGVWCRRCQIWWYPLFLLLIQQYLHLSHQFFWEFHILKCHFSNSPVLRFKTFANPPPWRLCLSLYPVPNSSVICQLVLSVL